jgi:uncharacterized protein YbcC (UPF0753/DUF2309 family)
MTLPTRSLAPAATSAARQLSSAAPATADRAARVAKAIAAVSGIVPPVWPLEDYVAVNPFLGLSAARFLDARGQLRSVRNCEMLPTARHLLARYEKGDITVADAEQAARQCVEEYPDLYAGIPLATLVAALQDAAVAEATGHASTEAERRFRTVAEQLDRIQGSSWSSHIITDISRICAAHYDQGQAAWPSPWRHLPLYEAWREQTRLSRRMDWLGIKDFRTFVDRLPADPEAAVATLLDMLGIPERHWRAFMLCQLFSVAGWASYLRYRLWEAQAVDSGTFDEHVVGLLAMRLAYDVALAASHPEVLVSPGSLYPAGEPAEAAALGSGCDASAGGAAGGPVTSDLVPVPRSILARYLFQVAGEVAYRRSLTSTLRCSSATPPAATARKTLQMVFCIDVRSEVFRRHLEAINGEVQTFGFAGFFAMSLQMVPLGSAKGPAQCPVLLTPGFRVPERLLGTDAATTEAAAARRGTTRLGRKIWKAFQTSATSCFSFVESLGLVYLPKLLTDSAGWTRPVLPACGDGLAGRPVSALGPDIHAAGTYSLPLERKLDLAQGMLRNLGLTSGFAKIVAICGHAADVVNNPHKAALDCGACGGHSGEPNARVAAALLNDREVRAGLAGRGIEIPADTWFVPAVHVTTTDEIRFFDTAGMPAAQADTFAAVQGWLARAGAATRLERSRRLGSNPAAASADIFRRSRDWSEVRPEWALAGNAGFIVAPRWRTAGLDLEGRTFLHDYEHAKDPELKVLELIMTAPMIVTSWINLQYFASAVDNRSFGTGNKQIHNVTGRLGVLLGNGGDLMTGLSLQSLWDGERFQHEPQRLLVLIEAPRPAVQSIIEKHAMVRDLVSNGWLSLVVREGDSFFRWSADQEWQPERPAQA